MYFGGQDSLFAPHFVGKSFVSAHGKPVALTVRSPGLQQPMQLVDVCFGDSSGSMVDDVVYTAEVVDRLDNVVDTGVLSGAAEGVGLEDIPGLLFRQPTAFSAYWLTAIYSILSASFR